jgi:YedE family putative selenium metabolism protein
MSRFKSAWMVILAGSVLGALMAILMKLGNPPNMGVCAICFSRDIAGALGLHNIENLSYIRPEIIGFILGATIAGLAAREFKSVGGSSPILRFIAGAFMSIGALVFLGCPVRMMARISGGDPTALVGLLGFTAGIWIGVRFLKAGFSLGERREVSKANGWVVPILCVGMLILLLVKPSFITLSPAGHAPLLISLGAGLVIGILAQRSRLCTAGGIRDLFLMRDNHLFQGILAVLLFCFIGNLILGQFNPEAHPVAHTDHLWNFLGMVLVGLAAVMIGGCPIRQMVLAGYGNADSGFTFLGIIVGAGFAHNFLLAAKPTGVPPNGMIAVIVGIVVLLIIGFTNQEKGHPPHANRSS